MEEKSKKSNWQITDKRFVTFLDIMGFKDLVMRSTHKEVYELLSGLSKSRSSIEHPNEEAFEELGDAEIYTASFSDSIVLFSKYDSVGCFDLLTYASSFLFAKAITYNIPLKGAMAYGEISINKSKQIYFGQPLIDAYILEEELEYYGVVAHHTLVDYMQNNKNSFNSSEYYFDCLTPLKTGLITHTNLDWFQNLEDANDNKLNYKEVFKNRMNFFSTKTSGGPRKYLDNTNMVFKSLINILEKK